MIRMRVANFHLRLGEARPALEQMSAILRQVPDYDGVLFHNFLLLTVPPGEILRYGLPEDRRAGQSYLRFLLSQNRPSDAGAVWEWLRARAFTDDALASQYAGFLLDQHHPEEAANVFAAHLGDRAAGYRRSNFVFNPDFRSPPTGCRLDWRLEPSSAARLTPDSDGLRIDFAGTDNLDLRQVGQTVVLPPGRYRLRARLRSAGVTTDQGVYVQLSPPGARTEAVLGDTAWKTLETSFVVSQRPLVAEVQVVRRPSWKFDNKIAGTVWVSGVELARVD
jgi:hypothetical protein